MDIVIEKSLAFIGENCLVSIDLEQKIAQHSAMMTRQFFALTKRQNNFISSLKYMLKFEYFSVRIRAEIVSF